MRAWVFAVLAVASASGAAQTTVALAAYCYNAGSENAWDCARTEGVDVPPGMAYHTIQVMLGAGQDGAALDQVLPIQQVGEVAMPGGERVVFLGRFLDSMKAFRVVEKCQQEHPAMCGSFAPKVVRIGGPEEAEDAARKPGSAASLAIRSAGDLVGVDTASLDLTYRDTSSQLIPAGLLELPANIHNLLWVDLGEGNLYVLKQVDGRFELVRTMSVSIGKKGYGKLRRGDKKTPVGVYRLLSHLQDQQLDDFYGVGAYTLNYPNALDRIKGRTGSGIWLHGLPKGKDHRPLKDSDGCVVLSNSMIDSLGAYVDVQNTPIVLDDHMAWVSSSELAAERQALKQAIDGWRAAWSAIDNDRYLSYYADDFTDLEKDLAQWKAYKRRIHKSKTFIDVRISDLSLLAYPGEDDLVLARFYQKYTSSNFNAKGWKEQLWRKGKDGKWRIVYEAG